MEETPKFRELIRLLVNEQVKLVVIGGVAMALRSADYLTFDLDICYERSRENVERMCRVLAPHTPVISSAFFDTVNLLEVNTRSEIFQTALGRIDLLGRVSGLGDYEAVLRESSIVTFNNIAVSVLTLDGLIKAKEAANRPKDQLHLVTLRALKEMDDEENGAVE